MDGLVACAILPVLACDGGGAYGGRARYSEVRWAGRAADGGTANSDVEVAPGGKLADRTSGAGGYGAADTGSAEDT